MALKSWIRKVSYSVNQTFDTWKIDSYELAKLDLKKERITVRFIAPKFSLKISDEVTKHKLTDDFVFKLESH